MVVLSDLDFVRKIMIPDLCELFESKFRVFVSNDAHVKFFWVVNFFQGLITCVEYLDDLLFRNYCRRKQKPISALIKSGILCSGLDWYDLRKCQGIF